MSTDQILAYFANKKLLPLDMMEQYFFDYLKGVSEDVLKAQYRLDGVFDSEATVTGPSIGNVSVAGAFEGADGEGRQFGFGAVDSRLQVVPFQNTHSVTYHMGLRSILIPEELDINPRTGQPEYRYRREEIGTLGTPDLVTDNGSTITLRVDSVTESGVSHAGRTVRVYLVSPKSLTWVGAYEDLTVTWTGSNNEVTTTGLLGQTAGSVSEVEANYEVVEIGPTIVRESTEDLKAASATLFLAEFDGDTGSAPIPDMTDQNILSGSLSDLSNITRTDAHGDLKVSVRADASDSNEDQMRVEGSGGTKTWAVDEAGLQYLPNSTSYIGMDDAGTYGSVGALFNTPSVMAAINQMIVEGSYKMGPVVFSGFDISGSGANTIDLDAGTGWGLAPGQGGFVEETATTGLAVTDGVRYLYITPGTAGIQVSATKSDAYGDGRIPLWKVTFTATALTDQVDLRCFATNTDKRGVFTIGNNTNVCNFDSFEAAFGYIAAYQDQNEAKYPGVTLRVLENIELGSTAAVINSDLDGLTIEGVAWRGASGTRTRISYDASVMGTDNAMFIVEANDVRFVGIEFETRDGPGPGTDTCCVRQILAGTAITGTTFEGCKFTSSDDTLAFAVRGHSNVNWDNVSFIDCVMDLANTAPTKAALCDYGGDNWKLSRCVLNGVVSKTQIVSNDDGLTNFYANGCEFLAFQDTNIAEQGSVHNATMRLVACTGSLGQIMNGVLVGCHFTSTRLEPAGSSDLINVSASEISGATLISKSNAASLIRCSDSILTPEASAYFIGGSNASNISLVNCRSVVSSDILSAASPITLDDNCQLIGCKFGPYRTATFQNFPLINVTGDENLISGCWMDASYFSRGVSLAGTYNRVIGNFITVPGVTGSNGVIGVWVGNSFNTIADNNFKSVGTGVLTGLGVYVAAANRCTITGNRFGTIEGAAVHLSASANLIVVSANSINDTGNTVSNPFLGAVSNDAIEIFGDQCVVSNNILSTHVDEGIVVESGASDNVISGNIVSATSGTNSINIKSGAVNTTAQLNNTDNGVLDNGTTSNVTGGGNI
jgi:hypothetical protein